MFKTVEIVPWQKKWAVRFSDIDGERADTKTKPNELGFYHYPMELNIDDII